MNVALRRLETVAPAAAILIGLLVVWELIARLAAVPEWLLPAPTRIVVEFVESAPILGPHLTRTILEAALGYTVATAAAMALAVAIDQWGLARRALYPLLVTSQTIPVFALAPLLAIWFGFGILPKVLVVALVCFFPIVVSFAAGLASADSEMQDLLRSMGGERRQLLTKVRFPSAVPSLLAGMKIAATYSVIGAVIAEWMGASEGLGLLMLRASNSFQTALVFVVIGIIAALSIALFLAVGALGRLIAPWMYVPAEEV